MNLPNFLVSLAALSILSAAALSAPKPHHEDLGDIIHKVQNFFTFLCTRCKEVVLMIDGAIDSQSLKKDANALCQTVLGFNEVVEKVCKSEVENILGEVYNQLKKLEPEESFCTHLHLCDACSVPGVVANRPTTRKPMRKHKPVNVEELLHGIAKLHYLALSLAHSHTDLVFAYQNQTSIFYHPIS